jgi:hypothetical protein
MRPIVPAATVEVKPQVAARPEIARRVLSRNRGNNLPAEGLPAF